MVGGLPAFFYQARDRSAAVTNGRQKAPRWGDVYTVLIDHNHPLESIGKLTKRQLLLLYDRALARERNQRAERVLDTNMGNATAKDAQAHMDKLLK